MRAVADWANVKDIDAMFVGFDGDGGGSLDVPELTAAMQELRKEATAADSKNALVRERIEFLQSRIKFTHEVADATREAEEADKRLVDLRDNKSAAARLGAELLKKNTKIAGAKSCKRASVGGSSAHAWLPRGYVPRLVPLIRL